MQEIRRIPNTPKSERQIQFSGLLTNKLLTNLPGPVFATVLPYLEPVSLSAGEEIYSCGSKIESIYFPETAVISQLSYLEDGSATEVAIIGNEGLVGLPGVLDSGPSSHWTEATIGGTALRANVDMVREEFRRGGAFQGQVLSFTSTYLNQVSQRAVCNSRHRLEERLCTWLLMVHDRAHGGQLPLTHELIAEHLGARRAGITSFCTLLREYGAIAYQRGVISIVNRQLLEEMACECYRALVQSITPPAMNQ
jgi:CRP-like cAMP-binding protein